MAYKGDMNIQILYIYETGKVAVSARIINSEV